VNQEWAVREGFKPCSTIKLVTGLAGLNEQVINPDDTARISDSNNVSLTNALAYSKNGYFQQVGGQVGFEKMVAYARQLGLGEKTGINMRNEFAGQLPGSDDRSDIARMSSHGDNFEVTPLQLATLVAAMSNGGKLMAPFVVRSRQDELRFRPKMKRQIPIDSVAWRNMIPGMVGAVSYGSGKKAQHPSHTVAGKTGTCIERGGWVGLFTSYAPLANPTLAVVVVTRGGDARGHVPAAVAGRIYRELGGRFGTSPNSQMASTRRSFGRDSSQSQASALDISEEDRNELANRTRLVGSRVSSPNSQVKPVLMQVPTPAPVRSETRRANPESESNTDGQTRPRRVLMR
jgi:cell division protein FtsI/penicillin-binding protein 2